VNRLSELCQPPAARPAPTTPPAVAGQPFSQRGFRHQRWQRQREHDLRNRLVDFHHWTARQGLTLPQTASLLDLAPRTLRQWCQDASALAWPAPPLGRPALRPSRHDRNAVIELLDELGPAAGVPTLQACFPAIARAELTELLQRYRRIWRLRHRQLLHVLRWTTPGSVWAMDYTEAPQPIDGLYPYLLAVRDLASGQQLLWLPLAQANAEAACSALGSLVALYGAPLVLKTDNGSPFCAGATLDLLHTCGIIPLFSPPYCPRYNGAIEAGIGSLKTRTQQYAADQGRPTSWSWHDAAAAREQANATARPKGEHGPTAEELWKHRPQISAAQRDAFKTAVENHRHQARGNEGYPVIGPLLAREERALDRHAIRRALVEHDLLLFRRRRIPLAFWSQKTANIR